MRCVSLSGAAKAITARGRGAVRTLDLTRSEDLECRNLMCEKLGEACVCRLARFVQQHAPGGGLDKLEKLDLSGAKLNVVPDAVFECLPSLEELRLAENGLTEVPRLVGNLQKLKVLDISNNKLSCLPAELATIETLETIHLDGNQRTLEASLPEKLHRSVKPSPSEDVSSM
mmetsp:Transcript_12185/g.22586  ORF Transcript_12185/g.22586 Transcript_12185/m.22586 type:complete len:172 (-) Transcript_12185:860-1375(-)